jgi:glycosyltransferase involved in cell wall biosynthesis
MVKQEDDLMLVYLIMGGEVYGSGGSEKYVRELAAYMDKHNYRVKILCRMGKIYTSVNAAPTYTDSQNVSIVSFEKNSQLYSLMQHLPNPLSVFLGTVKILKDIKQERSCRKILHIHDTSSSLLIALLVNTFYRLPLVVQIHGFPFKEQYIKLTRTKSRMSDFVWFLTKVWHNITISFIDASNAPVLVNNTEVKSFYESCGISSDKIKVVSSAIDLQRHENELLSTASAGACLGLTMSKKELVIGYVGGLRPEKNLELLIKAFGGFLNGNPQAQAKLILIGDGPMRSLLEEATKKSDIGSHVFFLGLIPDAHRFFNAIDILVLPSLSEGSPLSIIEAMVAGKAIIASDIPAIRELVEHEKEALLFNSHSVEDLKAAILALCRDPDLRAKLGANAKKKAKLYDVDKVYGQISKVYDELVGCKAR